MNVLVAFYSLNGETERLALAAAVGAVQGRAAIRLRRVRSLPEEQGNAFLPLRFSTENAERMDREYVAPKEADAQWADAIVWGMPARLCSASSPVLSEYCDLLRSAGVGGKIGAALVSNPTETEGALETLHRAMSELGLKMVPRNLSAVDTVDGARLLGRRVLS